MYHNHRKRNITLGQKKSVIIVDNDRINNDPMFLKIKRDSRVILQRIHTDKIRECNVKVFGKDETKLRRESALQKCY
jgi:hypothetical protein